MPSTNIPKYLDRYGEPEIGLASLFSGSWSHSLVVPCRAEPDLTPLIRSLSAQKQLKRLLMVVVINGRESDSVFIRSTNQRLWESLSGETISDPSTLPKAKLVSVPETDFLLVNRWTEGNYLPEKEGVGLARKIGCDLVLQLIANETIQNPWISTTDGDASLGRDYFDFPIKGTTILHPFSHSRDDWAHLHYEIQLRYYVLGLKWAKSPYGFHTIGSTISAHSEAYATVRGFPKRQAAEDFYFLNKLTKLSSPATGRGRVHLQARLSHRVPFGTGQATSELRKMEQQSLYPVIAFTTLQKILEVIRSHPSPERSQERLRDYFRSVAISTNAIDWLDRLGLFRAQANANEQRTEIEQYRRQMDEWFDGMRTYRWIRFIAEQEGKLPFNEALEKAPFIPELVGNLVERADQLQEWEENLGADGFALSKG